MATDLGLELEITDAAKTTRAFVAPNRGGMVTRLEIAGRSVLFLDRETFLDPSKNVRGGNPVLFPTPGKLTDDRWSYGGHTGALGQHGFARGRAWDVIDALPDAMTLRLASEATEAWPWPHAITLTYRVHEGALHTDAHVTSRADTPMPFGLGFHPYFALRDPRSFALESDATRAFDNVGKRDVPFDARTLRLEEDEIDLHLLDHAHRTLAFSIDGLRIELEASVERPHWVVWRPPGRDFVCVEPWTCPGDALNTGERLLTLAPGATRALSFVYRVTAR